MVKSFVFQESGISILTLLVTISVFSIISGIAAINITDMSKSLDNNSVVLQVERDLKQAQLYAIKEACRVAFNISASPSSSYTYGCDSLPYDTAAPVAIETAFKTLILEDNYTIESSDQIIFNSDGAVIDITGALLSPTITIKNTSPTSTIAVITLNGMGSLSTS